MPGFTRAAATAPETVSSSAESADTFSTLPAKGSTSKGNGMFLKF